MIYGQDWSGYQAEHPSIEGLDFAFVKITQGKTYVNPKWVEQRDWAKSHGLVWGAYHYPNMHNDPKEEADYFLKQVAWKPGDIIVLDWEGYDASNKGVSPAQMRAYKKTWLSYVKSKMPGHKVGTYSNKDYWVNIDQGSICGDFLWIAETKPAGKPTIKDKWLFHQYSTAGNIDHDVANFATRAALAAWAGAGSTIEPDKENDVTVSDADVKSIWTKDGIVKNPNPDTVKDNPFIAPATALNNIEIVARRVDKNVTGMMATIAKLASMVGTNVDTAAVVKAVQDAIASTVIDVEIHDKPESTSVAPE